MKIDSSQPPARPLATSGKEPATHAQRAQAASADQSPSTVTHLSTSDNRSGSEDIDLARVAELRQAIREGRLEIDAERIADGLIASVREQLEQN
ncbi:Negative regulator of flagellin synthesis flgM [Pseudomonas sp. OF001]|uniref:flagellar biosynthesis anti-sigma factor FlgM n=1 Tax=unclassified Pseudomonas TaxID=196821 RepID=UPI0010A68D09|nr:MULTISPECIES: flagellar biosynthesis anti-sigma factor FlgM [unclassified Pseudomonas]THG78683.1 flagellar biosynthesis anti-sigma factor FlgM [Pseudomonas sp. A-1]WPP46886.1 flagellar biosynthesis anti-sigma factor FlgM [Pseudomonas sp. AN-1]CAD5379352.1 Negative regulator of flagellin synthesis flgM [Pseudomonas sp. OF001]